MSLEQQNLEKRSLGELVKELRDEARTLFRQEVALAKTEMSEKASKTGKSAGSIAAGGAVLFAGLIFILLAATWGLNLVLVAIGLEAQSLWLAPLIVGLLTTAIGYGMVKKGTNSIKHESIVPKKTVGTLKEDKAWLTSRAH